MNELRDHVIAAHGGLDRWSELTSVRAHLINGGVLWAMKKQAGVIDDVNVHVDLHREFTSHFPFGRRGCAAPSPQIASPSKAIRGVAGAALPGRVTGHTVERRGQLHLPTRRTHYYYASLLPALAGAW